MNIKTFIGLVTGLTVGLLWAFTLAACRVLMVGYSAVRAASCWRS
jgi:hypothetical protein